MRYCDVSPFSDGVTAHTGPAYEVPVEIGLLKQQLMLDTVLYMPVEFDSSTGLSIHLVVNRQGAGSSGYGSMLSVDSRQELGDAMEDIEVLAPVRSGGVPTHGASVGTCSAPKSRASLKKGSKEMLSMEAHSLPSADGSTTPRAFTLGELNKLTGPRHPYCTPCHLLIDSGLDDSDDCVAATLGPGTGTEDAAAEWFTETLHFTPPFPPPTPSRRRHETTEMISGTATVKVSLRLFSCDQPAPSSHS